MDFHDLVRAAREDTAIEPTTIHGRKVAVFDLLADSGAPFDRFAPKAGEIGQFGGIDVVYNEAMPANTVELHSEDGRVLKRFIQQWGRWYFIDVEAIESFPVT